MKESNLSKALAIGIVSLGLIILVSIIFWMYAVTLTWLWAWFIVPFGVMQLSLAHAFGISGIVYYLMYRPVTHEIDKKQSANAIAQAAMLPFIALGFGYIYQLFM
jgi:hypothetical protein